MQVELDLEFRMWIWYIYFAGSKLDFKPVSIIGIDKNIYDRNMGMY